MLNQQAATFIYFRSCLKQQGEFNLINWNHNGRAKSKVFRSKTDYRNQLVEVFEKIPSSIRFNNCTGLYQRLVAASHDLLLN